MRPRVRWPLTSWGVCVCVCYAVTYLFDTPLEPFRGKQYHLAAGKGAYRRGVEKERESLMSGEGGIQKRSGKERDKGDEQIELCLDVAEGRASLWDGGCRRRWGLSAVLHMY